MEEASPFLRRGVWGTISLSHILFPQDFSNMAETLGDDRPVLLNLGCSHLPWAQLKWVREGLFWPQMSTFNIFTEEH
jgi:hypothetical protein